MVSVAGSMPVARRVCYKFMTNALFTGVPCWHGKKANAMLLMVLLLLIDLKLVDYSRSKATGTISVVLYKLCYFVLTRRLPSGGMMNLKIRPTEATSWSFCTC